MATKKILIDLDVDGDLTADSFVKDGGTSSQFLKADGSVDSSTYVTSASIPTATSDLTNDSGFLSSVTGDWTGTFDGEEGSHYLNYNNLTNKPTLFDGDYDSLTNLPTLAPSNAEQNVQSDWNATTGDALILNKPTLFDGAYSSLTGQPTLFDGAYSSLTGTPTIPSGNQIIDWTTDQGATNIHANNYTDTNTFRAIDDTPTDGATTTSISSNWAFDNVKTAVPSGALFTDTDTTYLEATSSTLGLVKIGYTESGKNYPVELSSGKMYVNVPWTDTDTDTNTTYTAGNGLELDGTTFKVNGGVIPGSANLNDYDESGYYTQNSNTNASSGTNYPTNFAGVLTVVVANDNTVHVTQTYDQYNSSAFYNRSYYNGSWSSWRNLAQDTNTFRAISSTPTDGATTTSISSDWAFDNVKTAVPSGAVFTDTQNTYTSSDFTHDSLSGVSANEHIDWTVDQGATNIHSGNYTDTNTFRAISSTPTDGATTTSISSDWAFDNVKTAVPSGAVFTDTQNTYVSSDFTHDSLSGVSANEHIDWTTDQGATNIHANNYTNTNTNQLTTFQVEDGDGTELTISHGKEWKFVEGQGINVNWTDTNSGTDADPFDLQFALKANGVRANELNVTGNGTTSQYLRSDGDGSFTWATPTDTNTVTNISISHGADVITVVSSDGTDGNINAATTALAGVINTAPQSFSGAKTFVSSLTASGGSFEVTSGGDRLFEVDGSGYFHLGDVDGLGDENYIQGSASGIQAFIAGAEKFRLNTSGVAHFDSDVIAYSTTISDRRLKDDIQTIENASETVKKLRGVSYEWNAGNRKGQKEIGLVAQEVEEVLPFLVREHELPLTKGAIEGELYKTVDYEKLVGLLIEDSKEKDARIERLEAMVELMLNK